MPALRGTRVPEGASLPGHGQGVYRQVPLWPGITWGHDARCSCSWAYYGGMMQVKVRSDACNVHVRGRQPEPEPVAAEEDLPLPDLLGRLLGLVAEAATRPRARAVRTLPAACGTTSGYNRHKSEKTPVCAACGDAKRTYDRERMRARRHPEAVA